MVRLKWSAIFAAVSVISSSAHAGSYRVSPVLIDVVGGGQASSLTIFNDEAEPVDVQIRVFRWSQRDGQDVLDPTADVVASPPAAQLAAHGRQLVRIVRTLPLLAAQEESYRLLVDQIPNEQEARQGTVSLLLRQSIPVFFGPAAEDNSDLKWAVLDVSGRPVLIAQNGSGKRVRLADLEVRDSKGRILLLKPGLAGYVLAKSELHWNLASAVHGAVTVTAISNAGQVRVDVAPQ